MLILGQKFFCILPDAQTNSTTVSTLLHSNIFPTHINHNQRGVFTSLSFSLYSVNFFSYFPHSLGTIHMFHNQEGWVGGWGSQNDYPTI